ncbi:glycoside hydrolase family 10 protein [Streptomyces sp. TRM70350]|uniref:glycoside hydrolase family 10 protein n=1 Tax=Streptomyces sp. TRM70350 TaxID=2856165 RepID=UPI001C471F00|nr:family 10 glycosylhydrolase [Streptomyces sp. TRM70350]MBV7695425.1 family 10 glycosylhydrolase [Streptomyces sp. TRM70350]
MGRLSRRAFALAALSTLVMAGDASAAPARRTHAATEMRGVWLATVTNRDWPSRAGLTAAQQRTELLAHLDTAARLRLNTVILQVRPTADALWPSPYEPWSQYLTGTQGRDPGWDPLGTAVAEAHARGLQLHAWFNPLRVAVHADRSRLVASHPARRHPEWVVPYGGKLYYNPGLPEVRTFVLDAMLHAVAKYPVDAVHFDDYFYPYPIAGHAFDDDEAYDTHGGAFSHRADWRRDNINRLVRDMAARIKQIRPGTRFGISPFGVWRNASTDPRGSDTRALQSYDEIYADTRRWVRENWVDYICPQLYWHIGNSAADYAKLVPWWAEVARGTGTQLYVGEALYKAGVPGQPAAWQDPAELSRHLTYARDFPEVRGHVFFAAGEMAADDHGAMARVVADHYQRPATPPR